jgi:hypothetical protein
VLELERAAADDREKTGRKGAKTKPGTAKDPNLVCAEDELSLRLGAPVEIRPRSNGGGSIVISCVEADELMRVFDLLMGGE